MSKRRLTILVTIYESQVIEKICAIVPQSHILTGEDLKADPSLIRDVDIVFGYLDHSLFPRARHLKWLQAPNAGVNWTDYPEIISHPFILTNVHIHAVSISEHLFGMLLMLVRGLHIAYRQQSKRTWEGNTRLRYPETLVGKTLSIVGLGSIGQRCAMLGKAHGMRVIGVRRHPQATPYAEQVYAPDKVREALARADIVMVLLPKTPHTLNFIGHREFEAMSKGVLFFNAGRGQTVHTDALVEALGNGTLKGAGLDTVNPEPLPSDHPLWEMPNVIISPHTAGIFSDIQKRTMRVFLDNLRRYIKGEPVQFVVDKNARY